MPQSFILILVTQGRSYTTVTDCSFVTHTRTITGFEAISFLSRSADQAVRESLKWLIKGRAGIHFGNSSCAFSPPCPQRIRLPGLSWIPYPSANLHFWADPLYILSVMASDRRKSVRDGLGPPRGVCPRHFDPTASLRPSDPPNVRGTPRGKIRLVTKGYKVAPRCTR